MLQELFAWQGLELGSSPQSGVRPAPDHGLCTLMLHAPRGAEGQATAGAVRPDRQGGMPSPSDDNQVPEPSCGLRSSRNGAGSFAEAMARYALSLQDTSEPQPDLIDQITEGATKLVPATTHAAVVVPAGAGTLQSRTATGDHVLAAAVKAQNATGQGPCLQVIEEGMQIRIPDLADHHQWPEFARAATAAGVRSMLCTPLVVNGRSMGVLTLIATTDSFDEEAANRARIIAVHSAIALAGAEHTKNMEAALSSRDRIGQAKGILMDRFKLTPESAFAVLLRTSADNNIKLRTVAEQLCITGSLPPTAHNKGTRAPHPSDS